MANNPRETRGLAILAMGNQIKRVNPTTYRVRSQSGNGWYLIQREGLEWKCNCLDFTYRNTICKHIYAVKFSLDLRDRVTSQNLGFEAPSEQPDVCPYCGSTELIKRGIRKNKSGQIQRYSCKACQHRFTLNIGFEKMRNSPQIITLVLDLYFKDISLRKILDHLKQFYGMKVTHVAVYKWIKKYVKLMKQYVDRIIPETSGIWHTDEMIVLVKDDGAKDGKGELLWLWNLMDNDTRFLLASQISHKREAEDARKVFADAKAKAQTNPVYVVTDGLRVYQDAFTKEFFTLRGPRTEHIRLASIREHPNNNMIERFHGTVRERTKVMRGLDNEESAKIMLDGKRVFYNFIRPHMSLEGKTPAEASNINLNLDQNKWASLIKQSAKSRQLTPNNSNT